jgi:hypothetical protein
MAIIDPTTLSPWTNNRFICVGAHYMYEKYPQLLNSTDLPCAYALVINVPSTPNTFLIKVPPEIGAQKGRNLVEQLYKELAVIVQLEHVQIKSYSFKDRKGKLISGFTGTADNFELIEYKKGEKL